MRIYKFKLNGIRVDINLAQKFSFLWTRVYGMQIGNWFFGAIKGGRVDD
jgi:hypothetical protein